MGNKIQDMLAIDFETDPQYQEQNPCSVAYAEAVQRLQWTPRDAQRTEAQIVAEAREMLDQYTFRGCRERFGLGSPYSLMKEMYCDVIACNAAVVARSLLRNDGDAAAASFLMALYEEALAQGFHRDREFLANRIDSRSFVPMRRLIDAAYLRQAGFTRPDNVLLCVGDCQTMQIAEWLRYLLPLDGIDVFAYQHNLRTLVSSGLSELLRPAGYFFFVNTGIKYGGLKDAEGCREQMLDDLRFIVEWLAVQKPKRSVFVTHAFCAVDHAIQVEGVPQERAEDALGAFADEAAQIVSRAPGARLVKLTDVCPPCRDTSPFRDDPATRLIQHYRFPIMAVIAKRVADALSDLTPF